ncbi:MAG: hypothetical protein JW874_15450 [Spirochaetales bacterium]|nr:hypothetical protein [Spirochaetales bacterium]
MKIAEIYRESEYETRLKAPLLSQIQIVMLVATAASFFLFKFLPLSFKIVIPILVLVSAVSIFLLRKGFYRRALYTLVFNYAGLLFISPFLGWYDEKMVLIFSCSIVSLATLLAYLFINDRKITMAINVTGFLAFAARLLLSVLNGTVTGDTVLHALIIPVMLFFLMIILIRVYKNIELKMLANGKHQITVLQESEQKMMRIIQTSGKQLQKGEDLSSLASETATATLQIEKNVEGIQKQVDLMNAEFEESSGSLNRIAESTHVLDSNVESQMAAISETSAAIEEMVSSIRNVDTIIQTKKAAVDSLKKSSDEGSSVISGTMDSFDTVRTQIDNISEMADIIGSIASQTNLLAMNAAIEAAHAGEAGKGFAVVAEEVRKLAESSNENSHQIGDNVKKLLEAIEVAGSRVRDTGSTFGNISAEIAAVADAMDEIRASAEELHRGGTEILTGTSTMNECTSRVSDGVREVEDNQSHLVKKFENTNRILSEIVSGISEIKSGSSEIRLSNESLQELSMDLLRQSTLLNDTVKGE